MQQVVPASPLLLRHVAKYDKVRSWTLGMAVIYILRCLGNTERPKRQAGLSAGQEQRHQA